MIPLYGSAALLYRRSSYRSDAMSARDCAAAKGLYCVAGPSQSSKLPPVAVLRQGSRIFRAGRVELSYDLNT